MASLQRSSPSSPSRKRALAQKKSALKILIPQRIPSPLPLASPPALGTSPESGSEGTNEPATPPTPRIDAIPRKPVAATLQDSPFNLASLDDDELSLRSLRISEGPYSRAAGPTHSSPSRHELIGPILFMKPLANGGQAHAFVVRDKNTSTSLVAKVFRKRDVRADKSRESLRGMLVELRAYKRLSAAEEHARSWLMELHAVVQDGSRVLFLMDWMETDLFTLTRDRKIPRSTFKRWIAQLALGIDALHRMGIIHRDIKTENILVSGGDDGVDFSISHVRIADFGHAWIAPGDTISGQTRALTSNIVLGEPLDWRQVYSSKKIGTFEFMAPEVFYDEPYGPMVDWWCLGHVAWDIITHETLIHSSKEMLELVKWQANPPMECSFIQYRSRGRLTPDEIHIISSLLDVNPLRRYRLSHLERHPYFALSDVHTLFDILRAQPNETINPVPARMSAANLVHAANHSEPPCHVRSKLAGQFALMSEELTIFDHFTWYNSHGLWAHLADEGYHTYS